MALQFGIEYECYGLSGNELRDALNAVGEGFGGVFDYHGGRHCVEEDVWRAERDGSLTMPTCTWDTAGSHEVISPIMKGENGKKRILKVARALSKAGANVGRDCGTHIHVGVKGARWDRLGANKRVEIAEEIIKIYRHFQPVLNALSPSCRFAGRNDYVGNANWGRGCTNFGSHYTGDKKRSAWVTRGVVEFRQVGYTLNPNTVEMWLGILDSIVKVAMARRVASCTHVSQDIELGRIQWLYPTPLMGMLEFLNVGKRVSLLANNRLKGIVHRIEDRELREMVLYGSQNNRRTADELAGVVSE